MTSWVIVERVTGRAILETFDARAAAAVNTDKYRAVPVLEYLQELNRRVALAEGSARLNAETIHNMAQAGAEADRDTGC